MKLQDVRAIITGAAGGLGREFCLGLARKGAHVAAFDVNRSGLEALVADGARQGLTIAPHVMNVAKEVEVIEAVRRANAEIGPLDVLINNAGIYRDGLLVRTLPGSAKLLKLPLSQWQSVIETDLTGPFLMAREFAAAMIEQRTRPGVIINISSISRAGNPGQSNYSAAKAGVVADTRLWAEELAPHAIRVAALAPGFIRTPILNSMAPAVLERWIARVPLGRLGEPAEILQGIEFILACDYFNGRCLDVDGGLRM